ncbi:MAG: lactonase family protein [Nitrospiraceae bacterium]|uniref:lactonase family protein n=1 Tax=Nitrospira cf. moscoviensis SBR1015 TaxID=96242 RepID=UPI000B3BACC1|nr:beta-propeller fold lactonase family protein [Nitrospira cf. moscoviensis SBR1015]MBY0248668.1 lactonase family protein [Nitrospiraceae bacterium]
MNTRTWSWIALPLALLLTGCPDGGGGEGGFGGGTVPVAYVVSSGPNEVQAYTVNGTTGALTVVGSPVALGAAAPTAIAVSPNGSFAYITLNQATNNVLAFTVDTAIGTLTPVGGSPFDAEANPTAATVSPNRQFFYVTSSNGTVSAYTINGVTGALTSVGAAVGAGTSPSGVIVSPNGAFLYVSNQGSNNVSAFTINGTTGALTPVAGPPASPYATTGTSPSAVTVSPNGQFLYVSNQGSDNVSAFTIGGGGALTLIPSTGLNPNPAPVGGTTPNSLTVSPNGQFLFASNGGGNVAAFTINGTTGELTAVTGSPFPAGTTPSGITVEPNGQFVYVSNSGGGGNVSGYRITAGTGALVSLGAVFPAGTTPVGIATPGRP